MPLVLATLRCAGTQPERLTSPTIKELIMADSHSTPDIAVNGTERQLLVGYRPNGRDTSTPSLTLSGKWLREAGFDTGKPVMVKVMDGCIVLMPLSEKEEMLKAELKKIQHSLKSVNSTLHLA